jgi:hypothetical protein
MITAIVTALVSVAGVRENSGVVLRSRLQPSGLPNELMMNPKLELLVLVV